MMLYLNINFVSDAFSRIGAFKLGPIDMFRKNCTNSIIKKNNK